MKPFENVSREGNEKAIRKGRVVPEGDVNLAYVRAPELSPKENVVVVDTSRMTEENIAAGTRRCKLYYANPLGILVDENDNKVIPDEYPIVTDTFSVDEDFSIVPGNEYTAADILPYRHVSRYFHLDHAGLTMSGEEMDYTHESIRVVNERGAEYHNYRTRIVPVYIEDFDQANLTHVGSSFPGATWAYRVFVYIDTDEIEDLYVTYNKIEVEDDGKLVRRRIGYKEILNPAPFFSYTPEESDVIDPANREEKIYSSKPISYKKDIIGEPAPKADGHQIYVPRKALPDPRLYQVFRWRVTCHFRQDVTVDPSRDFKTIKCGVLVTSSDLAGPMPSQAPFAFYNLARSRYNAASISFINPAKTNHSAAERENRDYWFVNIDTDDLSDYDILIWTPRSLVFNFNPYAAKIDDFVRNHGGTVFVDTCTWADAGTSLTGRTTRGINPITGEARASGAGINITPVRADIPRWGDPTHILLNANERLGGWSFNTAVEERLFKDKMQIRDYDGTHQTTRAEIIGALHSVATGITGFNLPSRAVNYFDDVRAGTPYRNAIEIFANFTNPRVAEGYGEGKFGPNDRANRQWVAAFLDRFYMQIAKQFPLSPIPYNGVDMFSDVTPNMMHAPSIGRMAEARVFLGYTDGTFGPRDFITQRQLATVIQNLIDYIKAQDTSFLSDIDTTENIYFMSYVQYGSRRYSQSFVIRPPGYTSLLEARTSPESTTHRPVTVARKFGNGHKVFSTFAHLSTCNMIIAHPTNNTISSNRQQRIATFAYNVYQQRINSMAVEGAMKLLYNVSLLAMKGRALDHSDQEVFSTEWSYSTPWKASWTIDAGNNVLSDYERSRHDFMIDAKDIHAEDMTPVWKRRLSHRTVKELIDEAVEGIIDNPGTRNRIEGAARRYEIEVTNPYVETGSVVVENDYPTAWTEAYTPRFEVPAELGPHIVKEEIDSAGRRGREAEFDEFNYIHKEFPEKPYAGRVTATYAATEEYAESLSTTFWANGTAIATTKITEVTPPKSSTSTKTNDIEISWMESQVSTRPASTRGDPSTPGTMWQVNTSNPVPHYGQIKPVGIVPWTDRNYYTNNWGPGNLSFPYWGHTSRLTQGVSGERTRFVQAALNRFMNAGYITGTRLVTDGRYGPATTNMVRSFQSQIKARWVDGIVDAETWSLIGIQVQRMRADGKAGGSYEHNYTRWFGSHPGNASSDYLQLHRLSNNNMQHSAKRSWRVGGPSVIWELYSVRFREQYNFHGVTIVPWSPPGSIYDRIMFRSVHVGNNTNMRNFDSKTSQLRYMSHRPRDLQRFYLPFGPYEGNTITIGVGQDHSSGFGTARMLGVRDIRGHTRVTTVTEITIPSEENITYQQEDINFSVQGSVSVESFKDTTLQVQPPRWPQYHSVFNIRFNDITVYNPNIQASITTGGLATFKTHLVGNNTGTEVVQGQAFPAPNFTYYSMDEHGRFNPVPETGWISKSDGLKLLCDDKKRAIGIPALPTNAVKDPSQRHYVKMSIGTTGTDASIQLGFYDFARKEFITSHDGKPEISFLEFVKRGPHNIYVAVISDYERAEEKLVPSDMDAPRLPFYWAMPVYGVCTNAGSKITLESLPDRLGPRDLWPIAVREGRFTREMKVRERWEGGVTTFLRDYQGELIQAFYAIPEAELGGYSRRFGPPNADIVDEEPIILDDDVLQVRQAPILMATYPTTTPNLADPVRPVVHYYKRATRNDDWVLQPFSEIRDFNATTGELFLRQRLTSNDSSLLRVDYTTPRRHYHFKRDGDLLLNLNSYSGHTQEFIGEALHVYIVPHFVKDSSGNIIPDSIQDRTLRVSLSDNVFDPLRPEYDPLAVPLGIVYISTALDLQGLGMIDTRRRGGGLADSSNAREVARLVNEASSYWDIGYGVGDSYQKSGHIVVRLPEALQAEFTEEEIIEVIKRNLSAGVNVKIENMDGEDWS